MALPTGFQNVWNSALDGREMNAAETAGWNDWFAANGTGQDGLGGSQDWVDMIWGSPEAAANAAVGGADYTKPALQQNNMQARNTQLAQEYFGDGATPAQNTPIDIPNMAHQAADDIYRGQMTGVGRINSTDASGSPVQLNPAMIGYDPDAAAAWEAQNGTRYRNMMDYPDRIAFDQGTLDNAQNLYNQSAGFGGQADGDYQTIPGGTDWGVTSSPNSSFNDFVNHLFRNAGSNSAGTSHRAEIDGGIGDGSEFDIDWTRLFNGSGQSGDTFNFDLGSSDDLLDGFSNFSRTLDELNSELSDDGGTNWFDGGFGSFDGSGLNTPTYDNGFLASIGNASGASGGSSFTDLWKV